MKTWLVMRHAKSDWNTPGLDDHERPLNARGVQSAPRMGSLLRELDLVPDVVCCSTAVRATETARAVAGACDYGGTVERYKGLYLADVPDYLEVLTGLTGDPACVLTVAHNPGCESVIERLAGESVTMPTAAIARLELDIGGWDELSGTTPAKLRGVWRPREMGEG